jgi:type II secretory pathway pseudopilin PulG
LARAEHELASYGRAVIALAGGVVMSAAFLVATVAALVENNGVWFSFSSLLTAGEVAAWRLKWYALPLAVVILWSGARLTGSIRKNPGRFIGLSAARAGFVSALVATAMIAGLIGITVPERLRRRQWAVEAADNARGYTLARALLEYREQKGTVPAQDELRSELSTLPDPDGSIAEALRNLDVSGYEASTVLAATSTQRKSLVPRGSAIRNASASTNPTTDRGVSFTSYKLRLPGPDKVLNNDDDLIVEDGLIKPASQQSSSPSARTP